MPRRLILLVVSDDEIRRAREVQHGLLGVGRHRRVVPRLDEYVRQHRVRHAHVLHLIVAIHQIRRHQTPSDRYALRHQSEVRHVILSVDVRLRLILNHAIVEHLILARQVGVTRRAINHLERPRRVLSVEKLWQLIWPQRRVLVRLVIENGSIRRLRARESHHVVVRRITPCTPAASLR